MLNTESATAPAPKKAKKAKAKAAPPKTVKVRIGELPTRIMNGRQALDAWRSLSRYRVLADAAFAAASGSKSGTKACAEHIARCDAYHQAADALSALLDEYLVWLAGAPRKQTTLS